MQNILSKKRQPDSRRDYRAARNSHQRFACHQTGREQNPGSVLCLILGSQEGVRQRADEDGYAESQREIETDRGRRDRRAPLRSDPFQVAIAESEKRRERRAGRYCPER